jgi:hypothetical protein
MNNIKFVKPDGTNVVVKVSQAKMDERNTPRRVFAHALREGWWHPRLNWAYSKPKVSP